MSRLKDPDRLAAPITHVGHVNAVYAVAFSPDGKSVSSGSMDRTVRIWDTSSPAPKGEPYTGHTRGVSSVSYSPAGDLIVSGSHDQSIRLWDTDTGEQVGDPLHGHAGAINAVAFSSSGKFIVSGSNDNFVRVWDIQNRTSSNSFSGHYGRVNSVGFSPDGVYVISGSDDTTLRAWDIERVANARSFRGHTGPIRSITYSPDGSHIASASCDNTIRSNDGKVIVWNLFEYDLNEKRENETPVRNHDESPKENKREISRYTPIEETFNLLLKHGCIDLTSQMESGRDSSVMIGGGGFGDIWTSRLRSGGKVAIKVWRGSSIEQCEDKALKRATREVYHWSRMKHQHVHQLLGVIIFRDQHLGMVSEWMENGNLHEYMRKEPTLDRYEMCRSIASGLAYMHECDALNVLISSDGLAKLADFGLSTISETSLGFSDTSNSRIGSTRWAAPELLFDDAQRSKESDIYALGMTMLEVITGEVPYPQCQTEYRVIVKVMEGTQPPRPTAQLKDDGRGDRMWSLLLSCWDKDPGARPSARQVLETLRSIQAPLK
ncbi:Vegetative incompatibility protein HET-E-1 [Rhizoctonia solani]|uniref:Vegetative incompatibility protein HET-E-1 n=1 Tax=Rhizoctonia solani TaxID=456999 RepID=A0A8H8SYX9_9AGAM|nr:Vegetative incompatibility protein HET-E-1 [Rhizoctonia solani]QRW22047.1 Vegetative incompatibility protein HET-E-1 [Rhizoctonia solani]